MSDYKLNLYIGQKIGDKLEITLIQDGNVQLLCDCGNVLTRRLGAPLPHSCKDCSKAVYARAKDNSSVIVRDLDTSERAMIDAFKAKKKV